jgi:hypothetical protein
MRHEPCTLQWGDSNPVPDKRCANMACRLGWQRAVDRGEDFNPVPHNGGTRTLPVPDGRCGNRVYWWGSQRAADRSGTMRRLEPCTPQWGDSNPLPYNEEIRILYLTEGVRARRVGGADKGLQTDLAQCEDWNPLYLTMRGLEPCTPVPILQRGDSNPVPDRMCASMACRWGWQRAAGRSGTSDPRQARCHSHRCVVHGVNDAGRSSYTREKGEKLFVWQRRHLKASTIHFLFSQRQIRCFCRLNENLPVLNK